MATLNLKEKYETGGYTALTAAEIAEYFKLEDNPTNFIYVINCLDGLITKMLYLDQEAYVEPWQSRRDSVWSQFKKHHQAYDAYIASQKPN